MAQMEARLRRYGYAKGVKCMVSDAVVPTHGGEAAMNGAPECLCQFPECRGERRLERIQLGEALFLLLAAAGLVGFVADGLLAFG